MDAFERFLSVFGKNFVMPNFVYKEEARNSLFETLLIRKRKTKERSDPMAIGHIGTLAFCVCA